MKKPEDNNWKLPPIAKIYEAFSVLADTRYEISGAGKATVTSSGADKKYHVTWTLLDNNTLKVYSNDNASRWQGYTGYPIIALLMINGFIRFNKDILPYFKGIPWNSLNKAHKNNYSAVVDEILVRLDPEIQQHIRDEVKQIFDQISSLQLIRKDDM